MTTEDNGVGGGMLVQWKKILQLPTTGVVAERSRESLPEPPNGTEWHQDPVTKQWSLQKVSEKKKEEPELVTEPKKEEERPFPRLVDQLPPRRPSAAGGGHSASERGGEEDWEFLSDKQSVSSHQSSSVGAIFVPRAGSVRSITSMEHVSQSSHTTPLSVPFKIQRTASSSTIDSQEAALGPSGKGVLGVDYVEHVILPTDTLQGICLSYRISVTKLRQANHFSGNSLLLAPKKLVIPISKKALRQGFIRVQDTDAKEYKLHAFLAEFPDFGLTEAKAYLELADWVLQDAIKSAREDGEWERDMNVLKSGEIRITLERGVAPKWQGAGIQPKKTTPPPVLSTVQSGEEETNKDEADETALPCKKKQPLPKKHVPAIATKTVKAQDVYQAVPQHDAFGVELQSLSSKDEQEKSS